MTEPISPSSHTLLVVLNGGFRNHTVALSVEGREVYFRMGVTTNPATALADTLEVPVVVRTARVTLSAIPGDLVGSLDVDVVAHPLLAIGLVGDATVSFEMRPAHAP